VIVVVTMKKTMSRNAMSAIEEVGISGSSFFFFNFMDPSP